MMKQLWCLWQCFNVDIVCACPLVVAKIQGCLHKDINYRGHGQTQELHRQDPAGIEVLHLTQAAADLLAICLLEDVEVSIQTQVLV